MRHMQAERLRNSQNKRVRRDFGNGGGALRTSETARSGRATTRVYLESATAIKHIYLRKMKEREKWRRVSHKAAW